MIENRRGLDIFCHVMLIIGVLLILFPLYVAFVAVLTTVFAVALGLPTAFALVRGRFPGRELLYGLFTLPMIVPLVIIAVAVYALFLKLGYTGTMFAFVVSHVIVALPFTIIPNTSKRLLPAAPDRPSATQFADYLQRRGPLALHW